ncbi:MULTISPECIES: ubiquinol-cytochrome c reductase iron-sulfur subunit [Geobacillus]|uniref:Menaquinol-cytochrome C reductase iron-sulfur subunit n=2 Tax=Geobacillus TaxID=129337 RepID=A0A7U9JB84_GEOTM|nr:MULTISPECIES: ubiquinol-cytochrome c reductase iron-sulfur subunit [Geobacillus]AGE21382.1 menaquinol:cytochrome c reductase iron-sulfur subunit [Geobacillus sp. GHH01]AOL33766.1 menaquinol-cytochrome C reductase [Geobacillus thermoleovorans]AWO73574.1 ubiquinol-cytochrome c reductase iron-sulfur subunit [Geobacillus thermoleovorans]ESU72262.1 menaquinol-cytochrome C reductase iron-sulfur subunit [Geobacillus sp. MAS1]OQP09994.1 menaquinol-cytochrome C reductase [Geobacillus thermoleovorans
MLNRREFLSRSLKGAAELLAVSVLPAGLAACSNDKKTVNTSSMANLGPLSELEKGEFPKKVPYKVTIKDAWTKQEREGFVYINKNEDGSLLIMSPICTHLGCTVGDAEENMQKTGIRFLCPCHAGQYDEYGINVGGPPPRPLDTFDAYIQDGNVYIAVLSPRKREK